MVVLSNFSAPVEGIVHQENSTRLFVNQHEVGTGTLYITENSVIWGSDTSNPALSLAYRNICLHAVQREPSPALYMQLDYLLSIPGVTDRQGDATAGADGDHESDEDEVPVTQLRFVPQSENVLQAMFQAMNECQAMHPDAGDDDSDYMEGDGDDDDDEGVDVMDAQNSEDPSRRLDNIHIDEQANGNSHYQDDPDDFADD